MFKGNSLYSREIIFEFISKATLSLMLIWATYRLDPLDLGKYSLASSIGVIISGLYGGGWIYRIGVDGLRSISVRNALQTILCVFLFVNILTCVAIQSDVSGVSLTVLISVLVLNLGSLLVSLHEVSWAIIAKKLLLSRISRARLKLISVFAPLLLISFLIWPSYELLILGPVSWAGLMLFLELRILKFGLKNIGDSIRNIAKRTRDNSAKSFRDSIMLSVIGLLTMSTYALDNIYIASAYPLAELPKYAVAFTSISFAIGVIGTPLQRILPSRKRKDKDIRFKLIISLMTLGFCLLVTCGLITLNHIFNNPIIFEAIRISVILYPYAIARVLGFIYAVNLLKFGSLRYSLMIPFLQISFMLLGFWAFSPIIGLNGIAASVSVAACLCTFILSKLKYGKFDQEI